MIIDHGEIVAEGTPRELKRQIAGDTVLLSVRDQDHAAHRAEQRLRTQPYVRELSVDDTTLRLYVEEGASAMIEILRLLDSEGIGIQSLTVAEPTLDDVFLRQTGRSLRDAGQRPETEERRA
jgi:ABC-2 type transport system ATP-binding protein